MPDDSDNAIVAATIRKMTLFGMSKSSSTGDGRGPPARRDHLTGWTGAAGAPASGAAAPGAAAPAAATGAPVPRVCPLGRTTFLTRPTGAPPLTGCRVTVTSSPALNEVRAQPRLDMSVGLLTSTAQLRTVLVSSLASN